MSRLTTGSLTHSTLSLHPTPLHIPAPITHTRTVHNSPAASLLSNYAGAAYHAKHSILQNHSRIWTRSQPVRALHTSHPRQLPSTLHGDLRVTGVVKKIIYGTSKNDFHIASINVDSILNISASEDVTLHISAIHNPRYPNEITIKGPLPDLQVTQSVEVHGRLHHDGTRGWQLHASYHTLSLPTDLDGIAKYLASVLSYVGPVRADLLVSTFGDKTFAVLSSPDAIERLMTINGIGKRIAQDIKSDWDAYEGPNKLRQFLMVRLRLSTKQAQAVQEAFRGTEPEQVMQELQADPWGSMCQVKGCTWGLMEDVAAAVHAPLDHPSRGAEALMVELKRACSAESHTHLPWLELQRRALALMRKRVGREWPPADSSLKPSAAQLMVPKRAGSSNPRMVVVNWELQQQGEEEQQLRKPRSSAEEANPTLASAVDLLHDESRCYLPTTWGAEFRVAAQLCHMARESKAPTAQQQKRYQQQLAELQSRLKGPGGQPMALSEGQQAAVLAAAHFPVSVITGGPGCGKTYVTNAIVQFLKRQGREVKLCAPTGRAAQRLSEVVGAKATTVHRLLGYKPRKPAGTLREDKSATESEAEAEDNDDVLDDIGSRCSASALDGADVVLVDEVSMLDVLLADALLAKLPPKCRLVLVGDPDQLPPVGPGELLRDVMAAGFVPVVQLREIFRQAGGSGSPIVQAAHAVISGERPEWYTVSLSEDASATLPASRYSAASSFLRWLDGQRPKAGQPWVLPEALFVELKGNEKDAGLAAAEEVVLAVVRDMLPQLGYDTRSYDLQVLSPTKRKGVAAGVHSLNMRLQQVLNPADERTKEMPMAVVRKRAVPANGKSVAEPVWRVGDKVLQMKNNADKDVYNGDQGWLRDIDPEGRDMTVSFPIKAITAERKQQGVCLPASRASDLEHMSLETYSGSETEQLSLAWSTTVHKAQGGEFKVVVLALHHGFMPMLLNRRLLYTALSRAKEMLVVVGTGEGLVRCLGRVEGEARLCTLAWALRWCASLAELPRVQQLVFR